MTTKPVDEAIEAATECISHADIEWYGRKHCLLAALRALDAAGWVCVPKEATEEMAAASGVSLAAAEFRWEVLLAAAPKLPPAPPAGKGRER